MAARRSAKMRGGRRKPTPVGKTARRSKVPVSSKITQGAQSQRASISGKASKPSASRAKRVRAAVKRVFAGVLHDGSRLATVQEVLDPQVPTRTSKDLSIGESQKLCLRRIKENESFVSMRMLGTSEVIDKKRALSEIKNLSPIGLHLLEIEHRYILLQLQHHHRRAFNAER